MTLIDVAFFACLLIVAAGLGLVALGLLGLTVGAGVALVVLGAGSAWMLT